MLGLQAVVRENGLLGDTSRNLCTDRFLLVCNVYARLGLIPCWLILFDLYQVQLFIHIFSYPVSLSYISFFPGLDTGSVGHMTWYRVRNILAQLCYAPDDSRATFRSLGVDASIVLIYPGLLTLILS